MKLLLVGLGGFFGSSLRYLVYLLVQSQFQHPFPAATLAVNAIGCFAIGVLFSYVEAFSGTLNAQTILFVSTGFLGGFTTFSAFGLETIELFRLQHHALAVANVVANLVVGLGAVSLGRASVANLFG